ncbi:MAG TPA: DUF1573 domain-containing protein [Candidatus Acidoferrum sp.]|nr:DUF1573 domain-containing protein [Candidatus Acidoferrum sp.]
MKKTPTLFAGVLWMGAMCVAAQAEGAPKIQFEQTVCDFGKTSLVATVSGVFKFKNAGNAILKVEPPKPSCGCTVAELKPQTLPPGGTGELPFTLNLGFYRATMEKHIAVRSNDPQTPEVSLTIKVDYTPLYDISPIILSPTLAFGVKGADQFTTITRTDGKPLRIARLDGSKPWITATVEPGAKADDATARIRVAIQRDGPPRRFNESVRIYATGQTNTPVSTIYLYGQVMGEVSLNPEALYWSVSDTTNAPAERPEALALRRVMIRAADGKEIELKNPQSTIKGIKVELVPKEAGKVYELVARLDEVPASSLAGNVSFETSVAAQPRIEVPVVVNVSKP